MSHDTAQFGRLLAHELRCAKRYRRFVSLLMVTGGGDCHPLGTLLAGAVRECDVLTSFEGKAVVLMSDTSPEGAHAAAARLLASRIPGGSGLRYAIASYPLDGNTPDALLEVALRRLLATGTASGVPDQVLSWTR